MTHSNCLDAAPFLQVNLMSLFAIVKMCIYNSVPEGGAIISEI